MKRLSFILIATLGILTTLAATAQDTLPKFSVKNVGGNRIIIGWVNAFPEMRQISVQRSFDSLTGYKTIMSVADPNAVQNGYADTKAPHDHMFYRLFYVLGNGMYYFSEVKRPVVDIAPAAGTPKSVTTLPGKGPADTTTVVKTPGGVVVKKPEFVPSFYVYSKSDGNVFINLPDADKKDYHIKFFEEDGSYLFEIKNIKEPALILEKSNFYHAGWFKFELYDDEKVVERHKFYVPRSF